MKRIILTIAILMVISGCSNNVPTEANVEEASEQITTVNNYTTSTDEITEEAGDSSQVSKLAELLECSESTAQSLCDQLEEITQKKISNIEVIQKNPLRFLKVTAEDGSEYYAELSKGYFIAAVYADSMDGNQIYRAIK